MTNKCWLIYKKHFPYPERSKGEVSKEMRLRREARRAKRDVEREREILLRESLEDSTLILSSLFDITKA
jgi:hypothetical protein